MHTDAPERATALFAGARERVSRLDVADMLEQVQQRSDRLAAPAPAGCGVVAVVSGKGMEDLFTSLGATPLPGGPTLNPSTYELLAGIHDVPAEEVVVLPNSPNVLMAAERAAELSEKKVFVVPTRSQQAGLAAAVALDPARSAAENGAAMLEALAPVRTGAVTEAARDDAEGRPGPLPPRRRGRLHRRADRRLGRAGRDARGRARRAGPRGRAGHADRRRRGAARRRRGRRPRARRRRDGVLLGRPARLLVPHRRRVPAEVRRRERHDGRVAAPPFAFASSDPLGEDELRVARWPRPSPARRPARADARARREGRRAARAPDRRRPARAPAPRPLRGAHDRRARHRRGRHRRRRGALDHVAAGAPARHEAAGRGDRRRPDRDHEGDVLQPAVARAPLPARARG